MKKEHLKKVPEWYSGYLEAVPDLALMDALIHAHEVFMSILDGISEDDASFAYEVGKWSIKDLILHISDAERVFSYRALRIARGDSSVRAGYDHNRFVDTAKADLRKKKDLVEEYQQVRKSTIALFSSFGETELMLEGKTDDNTFSAGMLGFIIVGHQLHHTSIIQSRYLAKLHSL